MMRLRRREMLIALGVLPAGFLLGCEGDAERAVANCRPRVLSDDDACSLCGMTIMNFPGPKGQACLRSGEILPFCSTSDLLSWAWQPESAPAIATLYMQDLSRVGWAEAPADGPWIEAQGAWYVVGHDRRGAMGHSPAPFSAREDAQAFAEAHGGRRLAFDALDWEAMRGTPR